MSEAAPPPKSRILVVDDEPSARAPIAEFLREEGHEVRLAADGFKALGQLSGWVPDLLLSDLRMPGMDGISLMKKMRERVPSMATIVMTAHGTIENAVQAMHDGAEEYLTKPIHLGQLLLVIDRVLNHRQLQAETARLREQLRQGSPASSSGLVGESRPFRDLLQLVRQIAPSRASVLITGEPGTGKELVAQATHRWSGRRDMAFVPVKCKAVTPDALESELFGTSSDPDCFLARASGGTLYLDEIAGLSAPAQLRLFEFLQDDNPDDDAHDVRVIAGTDHDLRVEVESGTFREDLYYRLGVINLRVPSLKERQADIPLLAAHFLGKYSQANGRNAMSLSERAMGVLLAHGWPGNIRELENSIERAIVMAQGRQIEPRDLPQEIRQGRRPGDGMPSVPGSTLDEIERYVILTTLEHTGGSTSKAARLLGISTRKVQYRLSEYKESREKSDAK